MERNGAGSSIDKLLGHPALRLLLVLKLKAGVRQQRRRLRRPAGWIFALLGLLLAGTWFASFFLHNLFRPAAEPFAGEHLMLGSQLSLLVIFGLTIVSAFNHRGLYLPKEEIELCFSAPLSRGDLVRYRMLVNLLRSLFAGVLFGYMTSRRMPVAAYSFFGVLLTMLTVPILGQVAALLLGDAENRAARMMEKLPVRWMSGIMGAVLGLGIVTLFFGTDALDIVRFDDSASLFEGVRELAYGRAVQTLLLPFKPWAAMITAEDGRTFAMWCAFCCVFWLLAFEGCARIRIDFRELSLATSADVAKRLNRVRRGGFGAGTGSVDKRAVGWRVPWLFGRGGFGAIAWLKLAAIVRKARGTLLISILIVGFLTVFATVAASGSSVEQVVVGAALLAGVGTLYLCSGLRFDFRQDLEQMETIKAWPVRPSLIFFAMLAPEWLLVSGVLCLGIVVRVLVTGAFHPLLLAIIGLQPLVTLAWIALDNAVFLFAPLRYTPGQEGALQHMGRSLVLILLRFALFLGAGLCAAVPASLLFLLLDQLLGIDRQTALVASALVAWCVLILVDVLLVWIGGRCLTRFDVARDRGT